MYRKSETCGSYKINKVEIRKCHTDAIGVESCVSQFFDTVTKYPTRTT